MATKYTALGSLSTVLSTDLNSLASGGISNASAEVSNGTDRNIRAVVELYVAAPGVTRTAAAAVAICAVPTADGTNYPDAVTDTMANYVVATLQLDASTTARRVVAWDVPVPPTAFKWRVFNLSGSAMASSGNELKVAYYNFEDA